MTEQKQKEIENLAQRFLCESLMLQRFPVGVTIPMRSLICLEVMPAAVVKEFNARDLNSPLFQDYRVVSNDIAGYQKAFFRLNAVRLFGNDTKYIDKLEQLYIPRFRKRKNVASAAHVNKLQNQKLRAGARKHSGYP